MRPLTINLFPCFDGAERGFFMPVYKEFHDWSDKKQKKERPWKPKKLLSLKYVERLDQLASQVSFLEKKRFENTAMRVKQCGSVLVFYRDMKTGKQKLHQAWFCKDRFCPMCQWRRSRKLGYQLTEVINEAMKRHPKSHFIFLTLTIKSVDGKDVRRTISALNKGFKRMSSWVRVRNITLGFFRSTEMTVNRDDPKHLTFHPHLHVILQVKSGYFGGTGYISQDEWRDMWQKAMKLNYRPMVRVSKIKPKHGKVSSTQSAVAETAKYSVKTTNYLSTDDKTDLEIIHILKGQMSHLRMASYGFELKDIHNELFKESESQDPDQDMDNEDLIHNSGDEDEERLENAMQVTVFWQEHHQRYVEIEPKPIIE